MRTRRARHGQRSGRTLVAGIESIACAKSASILSKHGSPRPGGTFRQTHVTTPVSRACVRRAPWLACAWCRTAGAPPTESLSALAASMALIIAAAAPGSGQRTNEASTSSRVMCCSQTACEQRAFCDGIERSVDLLLKLARRGDVVHGRHPRHDLGPVRLSQPLLGDGAGRNLQGRMCVLVSGSRSTSLATERDALGR
jgi:hypothetical protein